MNWLERARREISGIPAGTTANTVEGNPMSVTAVLHATRTEEPASIGSNGSAAPWRIPQSEAMREPFEERAAIMQFDGGMTREDAERAVWALMVKRRQLH